MPLLPPSSLVPCLDAGAPADAEETVAPLGARGQAAWVEARARGARELAGARPR